jgi:Beta xylosidase C-terminal Concanavalin A-like domain
MHRCPSTPEGAGAERANSAPARPSTRSPNDNNTSRRATNISGGRVWLRVNADIRPGSGRQARFSYSTDGTTFTTLGPAFTLNNAWQFFMGYRYAIFNHAPKASAARSRYGAST